jgi:hypothetical protein
VSSPSEAHAAFDADADQQARPLSTGAIDAGFDDGFGAAFDGFGGEEGGKSAQSGSADPFASFGDTAGSGDAGDAFSGFGDDWK